MKNLELIESVCDTLKTTLKAKNSNYGNSAFGNPIFTPDVSPREALLVRLSDKVARLQTLLRGEPDKVGESVKDTLLDMAGYCVLIMAEEMIRENGSKPLENIAL